MFSETLESLKYSAIKKSNLLKSSKAKYFVSSMLAGFYIGIGILFIVVVGSLSESPTGAHKIIMGACFGVALSLVIITGSELFTSSHLIMTAGGLAKSVGIKDIISVWVLCYLGNFAGSIIIGTLFVKSAVAGSTSDFLISFTAYKTSAAPLEIFIRAILCNILICSGILCTIIMKEETAKLIMIFWCVFTFITSGYEHSIANMALFTASYLTPESTLTLKNAFYNLSIVTLGNIVGGATLGITSYFLGKK